MVKMSKKKFKEIEKNAKIDSLKTELDRYVKTILRYDFIEFCTTGAYFNELGLKELGKGADMIHGLKCSQKKKEKLQTRLFGWDEQFDEEEYYKNKISMAKAYLNSLSDDKKEEIIKDGLQQKRFWSKSFDRHYRLCDELFKKRGKRK